MGSNPACPTKPCPISPPDIPWDPAPRVAALNDALLAGQSATATLERWCAARGEAAAIVAVRVPGAWPPPDAAARAILGAAAIRYRHVQLRGGALVLSVAENWYVPDRLTPAMNAALETTDQPFGRVVAALRCRRHTLEARILPEGGEFVLAHRAVLFDGAGAAVCVVTERYTRDAAC